MTTETIEERYARLHALAEKNGTSWDVEATKEISSMTNSSGRQAAADARARALAALEAGASLSWDEAENADATAALAARKPPD